MSTTLCSRSARLLTAGAAAAVLAGLAACSGGTDPGPTPTPPPPAAPLSVSGTAATGAALAGGTVELRCAAGSASGSTAADGSFTVSVADGRLPCALRVTAGSTVLHSLAAGSGAAARANLTPATELVVARHALAAPSTFFAAFDASAAAAVTDAALAAAQADVLALLRRAGVDFSAAGNLLSGPLVPAAGGSAGDAYDRALDALAAALGRSGSTLATLTEAAVAAGDGRGSATLPPELLLQAAAPGCPALRSTTYRLVTPSLTAGTIAAQTDTLVFDAATMTGTRGSGGAATWASASPCRFTATGSGESADITVSGAGMLVGLITRGGVSSPFWGVPSQVHTLAELAGTWNQLGLNRTGAPLAPFAGTATLDANGRFTAGTSCGNASTWAIDACITLSDGLLALIPPFTAAGDGAFQIVDGTGRVTTRLFAYRAGSGDLLLLTVAEDGAIGFLTPDRAVALPTVGTVGRNRNFDLNASLVPFPVSESQNTVTANDSAAGSWTRTQTLANSTVTYGTTLFANRPRRGYAFRGAADVTASDGRAVRLNEFTFLRLHGMGWSPVVIPAPKTFELSVAQPQP